MPTTCPIWVSSVTPGLGDSEVRDLGFPRRAEDHVGRLDVAVQDPRRMRRTQPGEHLGQDPTDPVRTQRPVGDRVQKRPAGQPLHDQVGRTTALGVLTAVVNHHDVRMVERCSRARLEGDAIPELRVGTEAGMEHLDRHGPAQSEIPPVVHRGHAALAEDAADPVAPAEEFRGRHRSHARRSDRWVRPSGSSASGCRARRAAAGCAPASPPAARRPGARPVGAVPARPGARVHAAALGQQREHDADELAEPAVQPLVARRPRVAHQLPHRRVVEADGEPDEERAPPAFAAGATSSPASSRRTAAWAAR